eukprot:366075-Chlamydomonas_euryale.AAC.2
MQAGARMGTHTDEPLAWPMRAGARMGTHTDEPLAWDKARLAWSHLRGPTCMAPLVLACMHIRMGHAGRPLHAHRCRPHAWPYWPHRLDRACMCISSPASRRPPAARPHSAPAERRACPWAQSLAGTPPTGGGCSPHQGVAPAAWPCQP